MRKLAIALIALGLIVASSANFENFEAERNVKVKVGDPLIDLECLPIAAEPGEIEVLKVRNNLHEDISVFAYSDNFEFENPTLIGSGEERTISGTYLGGVGVVSIEAFWNGGSAKIRACELPELSIEKVLLSGRRVVETHTKEFWTFRIVLRGKAENVTVKDRIPAELEIEDVKVSSGSYELKGRKSVKLLWHVSVDGEEHIDVTVSTRMNCGGNQEFTSPGYYYINEGAEVLGYGVVSNGVVVRAVGGD
ncbi:MAG: hypothetical protein ABWW66_05095 [Archaeoglobaceae archaeon]